MRGENKMSRKSIVLEVPYSEDEGRFLMQAVEHAMRAFRIFKKGTGKDFVSVEIIKEPCAKADLLLE